MKRQNVQQGHDQKAGDVSGGGGESSPRRMTERLNMLMTFPMATCLARLQTQQAAVRDAGRGGARLVEAVVAKMVLIVLGDFHGVDGRIYPSIQTIADLASCSERTAMRAVQTLEALGIVNVTHRNRAKGSRLIDRTNWYVLDWDAIEELAKSAGAEARTERRKARELKLAQRNMGDGSGDGTGSGVGVGGSKRPTVTCSDELQAESACDPRSHDQTTEQVTNGHMSKCPTVTCAGDPRSLEQVTHGHLNHTTEPKRDLTAHNNRAPAKTDPSRAKARPGPAGRESALKAGGGCEVGIVVEIETPIATLHRLQKREKAQNLLLNIGVRKSALAELLDHAEQEDPKDEGNPLPRVMAVLDACQKNKHCRSPIGWVSQAINEHWDLNALPGAGAAQHRKAGAA